MKKYTKILCSVNEFSSSSGNLIDKGGRETLLLMLGVIMSVIGAIWFYIVVFSESLLWGLLCLFIPFASLIFFITHFEDSAKPLGLVVLGTILVLFTS